MAEVTVIGPAVIDVLAAPFDLGAFARDSKYLEQIRMSFGGDALNEAAVLSRLGKKVQLISKIGDDEAGRSVLEYLEKNRIPTESVLVQKDLDTAVNIALISADGSRKFLMNRNSSLRRLCLEDVLPFLQKGVPNTFSKTWEENRVQDRNPVEVEEDFRIQKQDSRIQKQDSMADPGSMADIVSFASMFISPLFTIEKMHELFSVIKEAGKTLLVDVTSTKNGETIEDLRPLLPLIDVFVPNDEEIASLTGIQDPMRNVQLLLEAGVKHPVVKIGGEGCLVGKGEGIVRVPAVSGVHCVDTTGAGDTFAAGLAAGLVSGWPIEECARLGCAAASCSIEQVGATEGVHSLEQVMERYRTLQSI